MGQPGSLAGPQLLDVAAVVLQLLEVVGSLLGRQTANALGNLRVKHQQ